MNDVTQILGAIQQGDPKAAGELLPLVYQELRRLAAYKMANELPGQTLQPTALVHEVWLRLVVTERGIHSASSSEVVTRWKNPEPVGGRKLKRNEFRAPVAGDSGTSPRKGAACESARSRVVFHP
jgi:hypothetical protein